jgi:predicted transcriptional regulator
VGRNRTDSTPQGKRAKAWRERVKMSPQDLADATGYSLEAVYQYERGTRADGTKLSDWAWQRYQMACAAVDHQKRSGREFAW